MAPSQKRKPVDDDFVLTLSDHEGPISDEEKTTAPPPKKKAKTATKVKGKSKKGKKGKEPSPEPEEEDDREGIWGQNDSDDGAMDPDFEYIQDGAQEFGEADFEGWGFESAKSSMKPKKLGLDLDDIIRRRLEKKKEANGETAEEEAPAEESNDMELDLEDDEDGVLADDAFGMGAESEGEDSEGGEDNDDGVEDDAASDNDSIATPVDHPDDAGSDFSDEEDAEEKAKRDAFFAPEEVAKPGKKGVTNSFQGMSLSRPILRGLAGVSFTKPTPIQQKTIPIALMGKDLVGGAVTGSGKTAAFVVPILERLLYRPKKVPTSRVVILTPTRELAIQCHSVATKLAAYTDIKFTLAVGGLSLKMQEAELRLRPDVIIATPGRFIDHMRNSASFAVDAVEILVLDEADRMLEDGFADELNEILTSMPKSRQTMLFSATMTSSVDRLIRVGMNTPARVMVDSQKKTVTTLTQEFIRLRPGRESKRMGYLLFICKTLYTERVIIFFRQKKDAHRARIIFGLLGLSCAELHGSMNQTQRIQSVEDFRDGKVSYLLATDLASRGLDIKGIDTVINYEAPQKLEIYVHRVGRTARAGRAGVAVTLAAEPDRKVVKAAVKAGKAQGAKILSRVIEAGEADKWQDKVDEMEEEIEEINEEEKEERQLAQVEMQVRKGENLINHEDEIKSRPRRTWFESEKDKKTAKDAGRAELNGDKNEKKKGGGKMSNKDKKKAESKAERSEAPTWKKGKAERAGKGAVLDVKKPRMPKKIKAAAGSKTKARVGKRSLLRYLFPQSLRERYRERVLGFHLDTLPYYKHRLQSRIYQYILKRQRKPGVAAAVRTVFRRGRGLLLGPSPGVTGSRPARYARTQAQQQNKTKRKMPTLSGFGGGSGAYGSDAAATAGGGRRKKFAAMANNMYRAGATAVNEIREGYAHIPRAGELAQDDGLGKTTIPGSFPHVAITVQGNDQMVIFPSYAKRHVKGDWAQLPEQEQGSQQGTKDEDWWRQQWERDQDERAIVDVDVRGWVYSPHRGQVTRRNRVLIGLARQLSGIPAPKSDVKPPSGEAGFLAMHESHEERREQERIAQKAAEIEKKGQEEKRVAYHGGYSEPARGDDGDPIEGYNSRSRSRSPNPTLGSAPGSPQSVAKQYTTSNELTDAELAVANANLMARIAPFMTTPLVEQPITIFFYNDEHSASRTVETNEAGHFMVRAALEFVPTHVRVLANENLSATQEIKIIEPKGVSLISDIDDTVKRSNISAGAKEIFRNTFIRELRDLTVDGVKEWYGKMHNMGVSIHYCSNSPWQLFPVLASFFMIAGLPPGSLHLKQYSGMLQGIFEPVAERKRSTLCRLLKDFPERKFLLVGDSGEADLEVYTELVVSHPGRIIAVFIRDVTTPEQTGFFDSSFGRGNISRRATADDEPHNRPTLPPRGEAPKTTGPMMGNLIDFSDEPESTVVDNTAMLSQLQVDRQPRHSASTTDLLTRQAPPRPAKPASLRSSPSDEKAQTLGADLRPQNSKGIPTPPLPRKKLSGDRPNAHPLSQTHNISQQTLPRSSTNSLPQNARIPASTRTSDSSLRAGRTAPPPPPPRRRDTPSSTRSSSPRAAASRRQRPAADEDVDFDPLPSSSSFVPPPFGPRRTNTQSTSGTPAGSPPLGATAVNKKVELWNRRLQRAHETLSAQGVSLYTWRRGDDVIAEAVGLVEHEMRRSKGGEKDARTEGKRFEEKLKREKMQEGRPGSQY
ncbi:hypothetical protein ACHAQH_004642 [Verticillium albo-atrum]